MIGRIWRTLAALIGRSERCLCGHARNVHTSGYPYHCRGACRCPSFLEAHQ